jgi:acetylornithine deacetylase/succinyl-diaminopimelate desuccinylase-like protein
VVVTIIRNESGSKNPYATIGPSHLGGVMLSGHTDVVPVIGRSHGTFSGCDRTLKENLMEAARLNTHLDGGGEYRKAE